MTMWKPRLDPSQQLPIYLALADALAADVRSGKLPPGTRLPTHRALARALKVTVGTITRAFGEAARRGLISGEVGRGSFVAAPAELKLGALASEAARSASPRGTIVMQHNHPALEAIEDLLDDAIEALRKRKSLAEILQYTHQAGSPRHRESGRKWLARSGVESTADEIVLTGGAQHGMLLACSAVAEPGDAILAESVTFPGMRALARFLNLRLEGVEMDAQGARPDSFEAACRRLAPKAFYCIPTVQNPTARLMPESRRKEIVAIARAHRVALIEDDIYAYFAKKAPPPLAALAPDITFFICSLSKSLAPGLRLGYLRAPKDQLARMLAGVLTTARMASPLSAEIATMLIQGGGAEEIVKRQRDDMEQRQKLARRILKDAVPEHCRAEAPHLWLELPEPWRTEEFVGEARSRGVLVASSADFAVGRAAAPHAVRISLSEPKDLKSLEKGIGVLAELLARTPALSAAM